MKRLQLISDLHTEFWEGNEERILATLPIAEKLDFLVVAGDLVVFGAQSEYIIDVIFSRISKMAETVLYVTGNHEYYGCSKQYAEDTLSKVLRNYGNVYWLDNELVILGGVKFVGGTMWYPVGDGLNQIYEHQINDSRVIHKFNWAEKENAIFTNIATKCVTPETVVITHHMPHPSCTPLQFKDSTLNRFFVSDQSMVINEKRPRLWMYGHTHTFYDAKLGDTHLLCNPYGYPGERQVAGPYPQIVVEV